MDFLKDENVRFPELFPGKLSCFVRKQIQQIMLNEGRS